MLWALILYAATNSLSDTDSVALTAVQNIPTQQECIKAGTAASALANGTYKNIKFICVPTSK